MTLWHLLSGISNSSRLCWYPTQQNTIPTDQRQWGSPVHEQLCEPSSAIGRIRVRMVASGVMRAAQRISDVAILWIFFCQTKHVCMAGMRQVQDVLDKAAHVKLRHANSRCVRRVIMYCYYYSRSAVHMSISSLSALYSRKVVAKSAKNCKLSRVEGCRMTCFCWFKWEREREREAKSGAPYCESHLNTTILCHAATLTGLMLNGKELSQKWALPNPLKHDPISDAVLGKNRLVKLHQIALNKHPTMETICTYDILWLPHVSMCDNFPSYCPSILMLWESFKNAERVTVKPTFLDASPFDFGPFWRAALGTCLEPGHGSSPCCASPSSAGCCIWLQEAPVGHFSDKNGRSQMHWNGSVARECHPLF